MTQAQDIAKYQVKDYTSGSLMRNIWDLSWPNVLSMSLFSIPNILDGVWLGRLGSDAIAAAGIGMALRITMISPLMALSGASGAVIARYVGAKDQERANLAALQAIILFIAAAGTLGLIGLAFLKPLLQLSGATGEVLPLAISYTRIILVGLIAMEMVPSIGFMLVAAGSPELSLKVNVLVSVITTMSEPILVLGLGPFRGLGISGAALALVLGNVFGTLYALALLLTRRAAVWIDLKRFAIDWLSMKRIIEITIPAVIQRGTPNLAQSILIRLISTYGSVPLAAYNVVMRVFNFVLIPGMGVSRTTAAMVGQNLGARKSERAERAAVLTAVLAVASTVLLLGITALLAQPILAFFTGDAEVIEQGANITGIIGLGQIFFILSMVVENGLAGAGDTVSPMVINILYLWLIQLPLVYLLSRGLNLGTDGIWWAIALSRACLSAMMIWRFRQGYWKHKEI